MKEVYETIVTNEDGSYAKVFAENGFYVNVKPVKEADSEHTNPEQLIGASWATCLNITVKSILKAKQMKNKSKVRVHVKLFFDPITRYSFTLDAYVSIENLSLEETKVIAETADRFCPVSKLLKNSGQVTLNVESYE